MVRELRTPVPDIVGPGIRVLFCGINPSLRSAETGQHFAHPGNRFWKVLHGSGFTPELLTPADGGRLVDLGVGITNLVSRPTRAASELSRDELRQGAEVLASTVATWQPQWVAVVGVGAYRSAFSRPRAELGPQDERIGPAGLWLLANPSGLQARYQLDDLIEMYGRLRTAAWTEPA